MDRRSFLRSFGGGVVATATMAEAGMLAELFDWLRRKPVFSIPKPPTVLTYEDLTAATQRYIVPKMVDEIYKASPIFTRLVQVERDMDIASGKIHTQFVYAQKAQFGFPLTGIDS